MQSCHSYVSMCRYLHETSRDFCGFGHVTALNQRVDGCRREVQANKWRAAAGGGAGSSVVASRISTSSTSGNPPLRPQLRGAQNQICPTAPFQTRPLYLAATSRCRARRVTGIVPAWRVRLQARACAQGGRGRRRCEPRTTGRAHAYVRDAAPLSPPARPGDRHRARAGRIGAETAGGAVAAAAHLQPCQLEHSASDAASAASPPRACAAAKPQGDELASHAIVHGLQLVDGGTGAAGVTAVHHRDEARAARAPAPCT